LLNENFFLNINTFQDLTTKSLHFFTIKFACNFIYQNLTLKNLTNHINAIKLNL